MKDIDKASLEKNTNKEKLSESELEKLSGGDILEILIEQTGGEVIPKGTFGPSYPVLKPWEKGVDNK